LHPIGSHKKIKYLPAVVVLMMVIIIIAAIIVVISDIHCQQIFKLSLCTYGEFDRLCCLEKWWLVATE
jgi:hypothetical protein